MNTPRTAQMGVTPEDLLIHSRFIRDELAPLVASKGHLTLALDEISTLGLIMVSLNAVSMTLDLLRYSRVDKALRLIAMGSEWPLEIMMQAEELVTKWELALGSLQSIHADLWAPGGRLQGIGRNMRQKSRGMGVKDSELTWSLDPPVDPLRAYKYGHLGFCVGTWWVNSTAAFRDGIISSPDAEITANRHTAFAIVMQDSQETVSETKEGILRYQAPCPDRGVFKLMNTISANERAAVRVLRSYNLRSPYAPIGGLRYDGLYRIKYYGIFLSHHLPSGKDKWHYDFTLQREPNQDSLEKALAHPIAEELDDWKVYQRVAAAERGKATYRESRRTEAREMREAVVSLQEVIGGAARNGDEDGVEMQRGESGDSGYFSHRPVKDF